MKTVVGWVTLIVAVVLLGSCRLVSPVELERSADLFRVAGALSPGVDPASHQNPRHIHATDTLNHVTLRAPKGTRFPKVPRVQIFSAFEDADRSETYGATACAQYKRHVWVGHGESRHDGDRASGGVIVARVKPHSIEIWFSYNPPGDTLRAYVDGVRYPVAIPVEPADWEQALTPVGEECVSISPDDCSIRLCEDE